MTKVAIIGSGFSGLSSAAILSQKGYDVTVYEKNTGLGGRARSFVSNGYTFDMGPSWYWMPDVYDGFFNRFNKKTSDYYPLKKLDPGFQIIFDKDYTMSVPAEWSSVLSMFEEIEPGSANQLTLFMKEAAFKYKIGMNELVYQPGLSIKEFCNKHIFANLFKLQVFTSYNKHVSSYFKSPEIRALMEFPVLFLGTAPKDTPALYSLMSYSGIKQGTFYPQGGFAKVVDGFVTLCKEQGVKFETEVDVEQIVVENSRARSISTSKGSFAFDYIIASADYNHVDTKLLGEKHSNYSEHYWKKKTFSPSALLFYLGFDTKLDKLQHHNLFFDEDIQQHTDEIYSKPSWPTKPLFYACCPSKTDSSLAPKGHENLFLLMPLAVGLEDTPELREKYFEIMLERLEKYCGHDLHKHIDYKRSYCIDNFKEDYNAYKGNAYGLANTLLQTANLKPKIVNKKVSNLFYTGQLTVPGPGVPPAIISGQIVADYIINQKK